MPTRYHDLLRDWMAANPCPADQLTPAALMRGHESLDEGMRRMVQAADEARRAEIALANARVAHKRTQSTLDGANLVLDRTGVGPGLLADRVLALAVERETAREESHRHIIARDRALAQVEHRSFLVLVLGVALVAAVIAGLLAALGVLPTLSVA